APPKVLSKNETIILTPMRDSGEGGPSCAAGRWKGRRTQRPSCNENEATIQTLPPPRGACHRAGHFGPDSLAWSASPAFAGEDKRDRHHRPASFWARFDSGRMAAELVTSVKDCLQTSDS